MVCKYTCKCTISQFNKAITEYYRLGKQGHCLNTHFFLVYICIGELGLFVQFHFEIVLLLLFSPRLTFFFFFKSYLIMERYAISHCVLQSSSFSLVFQIHFSALFGAACFQLFWGTGRCFLCFCWNSGPAG